MWPQGLLWPAHCPARTGLSEGLAFPPPSELELARALLGSLPPGPLPEARSSAAERGLGKGQASVPAQGQCSALPTPPKHAPPCPAGAQGLTNIVRAPWLWGEALPVLLSLFLRENTAVRPALAHSGPSGEATSTLPPPSPPVIAPLKWRLIF